jgi:hypothetical protein
LFNGEGIEAVEGFAHVAAVERERNLESGTDEIQHRRLPLAARCLQKMPMNSAASGMTAWHSNRN